MRKNPVSKSIFLFAIILTDVLAYTQSVDQTLLDFNTILEDSLLFHADITIISPEDNTQLWGSQVSKITVPGREVDVVLEGQDRKMKTVFIIYPSDDKNILLVAKNETWYEKQYHSAITTFPMNYKEEVFYFPLGRSEDVKNDQKMEIRMKISIIPYLESLNDTSRKILESVLDSSSRFNFTGKDR